MKYFPMDNSGKNHVAAPQKVDALRTEVVLTVPLGHKVPYTEGRPPPAAPPGCRYVRTQEIDPVLCCIGAFFFPIGECGDIGLVTWEIVLYLFCSCWSSGVVTGLMKYFPFHAHVCIHKNHKGNTKCFCLVCISHFTALRLCS